MRRLLAVIGALAMTVVAPAAAHVVPQPAFLTPGAKTTVTFAAPNERPPHALTEVSITAPPGIRLERAAPPDGWRLSLDGQTAIWHRTGPRSGAPSDASFVIVASTTLAPGTVAWQAIQRYDDGGIVRWQVSFTILPAPSATPKQHLLPAIVTAILGLVVIALLLLRMRGRGRPELRQE